MSNQACSWLPVLSALCGTPSSCSAVGGSGSQGRGGYKRMWGRRGSYSRRTCMMPVITVIMQAKWVYCFQPGHYAPWFCFADQLLGAFLLDLPFHRIPAFGMYACCAGSLLTCSCFPLLSLFQTILNLPMTAQALSLHNSWRYGNGLLML